MLYWAVSSSCFAVFTPIFSLPVSAQSDVAVLSNESVCNPSSISSALSSMRTRQNRLQTVIVHGQESRRAMDKMSKLHRSRLDTSICTRWSGSSQLASETLSRIACPGTMLHRKPTQSEDQLREMCSSPALCAQTQCSDDVRLGTVFGISTRKVWNKCHF